MGETFHLDVDGAAIAGRYVDVDPPHRLVMEWEPQGAGKSRPTPALIEITLTPTDHGTRVKVQLSGLSAGDTAFYRHLWARHLDQIAAALPSAEPRRALEEALEPDEDTVSDDPAEDSEDS
jgi:uncharacterized protein YndB with AHSA1/START domain